MRYQKLFTTLVALGLTAGAFGAADPVGSFGIVNFGTCITDSKLGKQEQASFESLKKQMSSLLEETEKQLNEISTKFNDPEYLDGLSPEAEEEMKNKFRALSEDLNRYQNQYYQVLNQANMRIVQTMGMQINTAAERVAKDKRLSMVINKEACFFFNPLLEITPLVISEMDKTYDEESKKQVASAASTPAVAPAAQVASTAETAAAPAAVPAQAAAPTAAPVAAKTDTKAEVKADAKAEVKSEAKTATAPAAKQEAKTAAASKEVAPAAKAEEKVAK